MRDLLIRLLARWRRGATPKNPEQVPEQGGQQGPPNEAVPMLDCESVMRQLWDFLDGELTPERMAAIRWHIEMCKRCYPQHEFERSFLQAVGASARSHSGLDQLRFRLLESLEARGLHNE